MGLLNDIVKPFTPIITGLLGYQGQKETNQQNIQLGREQMAFQERMANTSWQRGVKDMEAAGLNPMLAYSQGGASAPMGSMPQVQSAVGAGVSSAKQGSETIAAMQQIESNKATIEQIKATTAKIQSETMERNLNTAKLIADTDVSEQTADRVARDANLSKQRQLTEKYNTESASYQAAIDKELARQGIQEGSFAADTLRRKIENRLKELQIPEAKAFADYYSSPMGRASPYQEQVQSAIGSVLGGANSAARTRSIMKPKSKVTTRESMNSKGHGDSSITKESWE